MKKLLYEEALFQKPSKKVAAHSRGNEHLD